MLARPSSLSCQPSKANSAPYMRQATSRFSARKITQPSITSRKVNSHFSGLITLGAAFTPNSRSMASHMPCQAPQIT
ncbi:hypothetical protein D9M69_699800 [compost metagenome]